MTRAYYNEIDPFAAHWLYNLIQRNLIAPGDIDTRDIRDVRPIDLKPYTQCHFFAGIGVWSHALRRAGWSDDREVWTGSCPCQPFSAAGKGGGFADERHLWPAFHHLIAQCRPDVVLGEQVASKDGLLWLDLVQSDMEGTDYAFGAVDSCSAGFGAPHIRQRLYWMAYAMRGRAEHASRQGVGAEAAFDDQDGCLSRQRLRFGIEGATRLVAHHHPRLEGRRQSERERAAECAAWPGGVAGELADANGGDAGAEGLQRSGQHGQQPEDGGSSKLADAARSGRREERADVGGLVIRDRAQGLAAGFGSSGSNCSRPRPTNGFWRDADWLLCRDGKWRPVEPGTFPLAHGAAARVGRLRAYGNAINAEQATAFCEVAKEFLQ